MDDTLTLLGGSRLSWGWYAGRAEAAASAAVLLCFCLSQLIRQLASISIEATTLASYQTVLSREIIRQNEANTTLSQLARQDGLTLLANRRCFDETLSLEWRRARRDDPTDAWNSGQPLAKRIGLVRGGQLHLHLVQSAVEVFDLLTQQRQHFPRLGRDGCHHLDRLK